MKMSVRTVSEKLGDSLVLCVFTGTDVNATVIGENDPIDEVQGFLFGRLR